MMKHQSSLLFGLVVVAIAVFLRRLVQQKTSDWNGKYVQFRETFQEEHDHIDAQFHHHDVVVDGIQWHYVDEGPADGPVILFMHGFPETWYSWRYVLPLVDKRYRLIAIDMKGYGRSDKVDEDYNWAVVAEQTKNLMTKGLGVDKFYVVAHDWGTIIGGILVNNHQANILGFVRMQIDLILPDGFKSTNIYSSFRTRPQFLAFQWEWLARLILADTKWILNIIYQPRLTSTFREEDRNYLVHEFSQPRYYHLYRYFLAKNWDFETTVAAVCKNNYAFPVMQLEADSDPSQPASLFDNVAVECPNVEMAWIRNASHFSNFDQPEAVATAINRFINSHHLVLADH